MSKTTAPPLADVSEPGSTRPVFVAHMDARWGDLDAFNHVNNAAYLVYLQEARLQWMQGVPDWHGPTGMPVVAAAELNYRRPIAWPEVLAVELSCTRAGTTSIILAHRIVSAGDANCLYCDGHVVMVWVDPATGQPAPLPASIRAAVTAPSAG